RPRRHHHARHRRTLWRGAFPHPRRSHPHRGRLFGERHHRHLRPHPRKPPPAGRHHQGTHQRGDQRHLVTHAPHLHHHHPHRGHPPHVRWLGTAGFLIHHPCRTHRRHILLHLHRLPAGPVV